mmetsp:Transcript_9321/g.26889  ORF Transcript_9321/g.26889 Transcript_9321/m.26889 type:complete len:220 (-) Transcript_9321:101-760(-)
MTSGGCIYASVRVSSLSCSSSDLTKGAGRMNGRDIWMGRRPGFPPIQPTHPSIHPSVVMEKYPQHNTHSRKRPCGPTKTHTYTCTTPPARQGNAQQQQNNPRNPLASHYFAAFDLGDTLICPRPTDRQRGRHGEDRTTYGGWDGMGCRVCVEDGRTDHSSYTYLASLAHPHLPFSRQPSLYVRCSVGIAANRRKDEKSALLASPLWLYDSLVRRPQAHR